MDPATDRRSANSVFYFIAEREDIRVLVAGDTNFSLDRYREETWPGESLQDRSCPGQKFMSLLLYIRPLYRRPG